MTMTDPLDRLLPDHPDDDGLRVGELADLLAAVYEALAIPMPATQGDGARHDELLLERITHVRLTLRRVLVEGASAAERSRRLGWPDVTWETAYLREQLAGLAPSGYKTAPWPGVPVEEFLAHGQTGPGHCPRCGRQILDVDPDGLENTTTGERWCITHHTEAFTDAFGATAGAAAASMPTRRLLVDEAAADGPGPGAEDLK